MALVNVMQAHVAKPVLDAMYNKSVADGGKKGLLVAVSFDETIADGGIVKNNADVTLVPASCGGSSIYEKACVGCRDQYCTFGFCAIYDVDCIGPGVNGLSPEYTAFEALQFYAMVGGLYVCLRRCY